MENLTLLDSTGKIFLKTLKWTILVFFLLVALLPLLWLFMSSFKTHTEIELSPLALPAALHVRNYVQAINISSLHLLFLHSVFVAVGATILNLFIASMASFAISRENFRFKKLLFTVLVAGILVPIISFMVPYFKIISTLNLYDSLYALILVYAAINIPVSMFLVRSFMDSIPKELEESAVIDGCNFYQRYWYIILPLSKVGLVTAGTFVFLFAWNEFVYALLLTSSLGSRTLQLGIRFFTSQFRSDYGAMYAAIILTILPSIAVYISFHERIISGLTSGAVKG